MDWKGVSWSAKKAPSHCPMDGLIAQEWETDMLRYLKKNGARLGPKEIAGKFDGYSEAWLKVNFEMKSLVMLMNQIKDSEA